MLGLNESVNNAFTEMGFTKDDAKHYYDEVENGGVALFAKDKTGDKVDDSADTVDLPDW